ncbi:MAG: ABA4-like family protein [Myxococcota bacterium]
MDPELVFTLVNALPMPIWLTWFVAPRSTLARWFADALWPWALLAAIYVALLAVTFSGPSPGGDFFSLAGVMRLFDSEWGTLAGWTHYLCFDLFVARWIMREAPDAGYRLTPILVGTLMFGPLGLLLFFGARRWLVPATLVPAAPVTTAHVPAAPGS